VVPGKYGIKEIGRWTIPFNLSEEGPSEGPPMDQFSGKSGFNPVRSLSENALSKSAQYAQTLRYCQKIYSPLSEDSDINSKPACIFLTP